MFGRSKAFIGFLCVLAFLCMFYSDSYANSSGAFMSLPFGHMWGRTKLRMEGTGAAAISEKKGVSLIMRGMFEEREALFVFSFVSKKGLSTKTVNISSLGNAQDDRSFYDALRMGYESRFGEVRERSIVGKNNSIALQAEWNPDKYTSIILTYNPDIKKFSDNLMIDSPIRLSYMTNKWAK